MSTPRILCLSGAILVVMSCGTSAVPNSTRTVSTNTPIRRDQLAIAGISIGSPEKDVLRAFGRPTAVREEPDGITGQPSRLLSYPGVEVYLLAGEVYNLKCSTSAYSTHDSVRVGDSVEKLERVYGPGERYRVASGELIRFNVSGTDTYLIFHLQGAQVSGIELWFDYT